MKYAVNIIDGCAYVHGNTKKGEHVYIFADGATWLSIQGIHLRTPTLYDLFLFVGTLPKKLSRSIGKPSSDKMHWRFGRNQISLTRNVDPAKLIKKIAAFLRRIGPLLEMVAMIREQINRRPLTGNASINLYTPRQVIDGVAVEDWVAMHKAAGEKIDAKTAKVHRTFTFVGYPYNIYPELPDEVKCTTRDYFARAPGSK